MTNLGAVRHGLLHDTTPLHVCDCAVRPEGLQPPAAGGILGMPHGPLHGYRIVDLTWMLAGPASTSLLGDQGADVVKVEPPGRGDLVREMGPRREGISATFVTVNRNKRSVALDLKQPRGRELLGRLVAGADVFVQNFRPGVTERMGVGEAAMRQHRPDLIYVSLSGFGETGPYAHQRVYDPVIQALSGLADVQRDRESGRPHMIRTIIPDPVTALTAAQAITAALLARERSGEGQHLRLAMLDAVIAFLWPEAMAAYTWRSEGPPEERRELSPDLIFQTKDGYITAGSMSDAEWRGFARALERPEWIEDPRFRTPGDRIVHNAERRIMAAEVLRDRSSAEWLERLDAEGVPCAPVLSRHEILTHPQVVANDLLVELEHPSGGPMRQARAAARFERTPTSLRLPAPQLGEHSDEILGELGLAADELEQLHRDGVVG